jgi:hypothetical protein
MEIMRAREANGLPVISPMLGLPPEKWECEFRDYLVALGDPELLIPSGWRLVSGRSSVAPGGSRSGSMRGSRDRRTGSTSGRRRCGAQ